MTWKDESDFRCVHSKVSVRKGIGGAITLFVGENRRLQKAGCTFGREENFNCLGKYRELLPRLREA